MRNKNSHRLIAYSVSSAVYLLFWKHADTQIVYTDIDPDTILADPPNEAFLLDVDLNGTIDITFQKFAHSNFSDWCDCMVYRSEGNIGATMEKAAFSASFFSTTSMFVYALDHSYVIDSELQFTAYDVKLAYKIIPDWTFYYVFEGGEWFPEAIDRFIGIRFQDSIDCLHYGWIRCDVLDEGRTLIIKDYAYESKCDVGILAGDTIGDTSTVAISNSPDDDIQINIFNDNIYVNLTSLQENTGLHIYDVSGREVYYSVIRELHSVIPFSEPTGIYFVTISSSDGWVTRKIYLD